MLTGTPSVSKALQTLHAYFQLYMWKTAFLFFLGKSVAIAPEAHSCRAEESDCIAKQALSHDVQNVGEAAAVELLQKGRVFKLHEGSVMTEAEEASWPRWNHTIVLSRPEVFTCASFGWQPIGGDRKPRVVDAYAYNGESLIASARYEELKDYINGTAILTTSANFHGETKEAVEPPHIPKLHRVVLPATAFDECDKNGFNYCALSITKNGVALPVEHFELDDDDFVIFSDPDEIPDREVVRLLHECDVPIGPGHTKDHLILQAGTRGHYLYSFRCGYPKSPWAGCQPDSCKGPVVIRAGTMRAHGLRSFQSPYEPYCVNKGKYSSCYNHKNNRIVVDKSFWHLSSFGGPEALQTKLNDNSDKFGAADRDLLQIARDCVDLNEEHDFSSKEVQRFAVDLKYPYLPHSVADFPERYPLFFDWDQGANSTSAKLK